MSQKYGMNKDRLLIFLIYSPKPIKLAFPIGYGCKPVPNWRLSLPIGLYQEEGIVVVHKLYRSGRSDLVPPQQFFWGLKNTHGNQKEDDPGASFKGKNYRGRLCVANPLLESLFNKLKPIRQ